MITSILEKQEVNLNEYIYKLIYYENLLILHPTTILNSLSKKNVVATREQVESVLNSFVRTGYLIRVMSDYVVNLKY